ncbi:MAG: leucine-rich repeat protein [Lachnospiraceae bacterium]|nr:leucine-rich repeat protein [Lachnospiraceae bacterium]
MGDHAFDGCNQLTELEIPNGVESIGSAAFIGCSSLTKVSLPSSLESISESLFYKSCFFK